MATDPPDQDGAPALKLGKSFHSGLVADSRITYKTPAMKIQFLRDEHERTVFEVALDDATVARLMEVADLSHAPPALLIASIVHDVLADDEAAHQLVDPAAQPHLN